MPERSTILNSTLPSPPLEPLQKHQRNGSKRNRLGVAVVGVGGAVATTAVAGIELLRVGKISANGLPLATYPTEFQHLLAKYEDLVFAGWDLCSDNLAKAAKNHNVLTDSQLAYAEPMLSAIEPWPAVGNQEFCRNILCTHFAGAATHLEAVELIRRDLQRFRGQQKLDGLVVVNLASTERQVDIADPQFSSLEAFEAALQKSSGADQPSYLVCLQCIVRTCPIRQLYS